MKRGLRGDLRKEGLLGGSWGVFGAFFWAFGGFWGFGSKRPFFRRVCVGLPGAVVLVTEYAGMEV